MKASGVTYGPGRPPVHEKEWTKVTVVLLNRQIVALLDALTQSGVNLTAAPSEANLRETLLANLRKETEVQ